jgi:thiamine kinase-like enzyme
LQSATLWAELAGTLVYVMETQSGHSWTKRLSAKSCCIQTIRAGGHNIVFTHADLNLRNILVDQVVKSDGTRGWGIPGIVDWENSGYYPEYWDYTKALFEGFRYNERWNEFMHQIFKPFGDLSKEFEIEKKSWGEGDGVM